MKPEQAEKLLETLRGLVGRSQWIYGVGIGGKPDDPKVVVLVKDSRQLAEAKGAVSVMGIAPEDVEIMEVGEIRALAFFRGKAQRGRVRPLEAGVSIGDAEVPGACTLTGIFTDGSKHYALTNAHCVKGAMTCEPGDLLNRPLIQPSLLDGGDPIKDIIAVTVRASDITRTGSTDTVVAELRGDVPYSSKVFGLDIYFTGNIREPLPGDIVTKSGRTSGVTTGIVLVKNVSIPVVYPCGERIVSGVAITTKMLDPGDSGSPIVDIEGNLVGQGFAGSDAVSLIIPVSSIVNEFGVMPIRGGRRRIMTIFDWLGAVYKLLETLYDYLRRLFKRLITP